ncbi:MAG: cobalamin-dependent protein [Deltaproteobacteria bacterium]|nr:cobalamin-dependent protein [Deltaproteobacteria bacterium]
MRVAVIAPPYPLEEAPSPPLGVCYVASAFEATGADVKIIDYIVSRYTPDKLKDEIDTFKPDIVGATSVTMNFPIAASIIKTAKQHNPSILTMMGGPHVSFDPVNTLLKYPEIDVLVIGEGENTLKELVPHIKNKSEWANIKGIAFREGEKVIITRPRELIQNLDSLPLPARHLLPLSRYQILGFPISMITSRGCPYQCIFCVGRRMVGNRVRYRGARFVVDEIEHILSYGFSRINIADDLFTSNKTKVREICEEILRRGLTFSWSAFARVNTVDEEVLTLMRDAGCDTVSFGIESGNPEMLKRIKKGITLDHARRAVKLCKEVGMLAHASFMVGLPGESPETLKDTHEFAQSLDIPYGYHFLAPFPGTTVREEIERYDLEILTHDWSRYDANSAIVRTSKLSPEETESFVAEFDKQNDEKWEDLKKGYINGTNTPEENLRVEGYYRMNLVYRLLSEDIIEEYCTFPIDSLGKQPREKVDLLCKKITKITKMDTKLITNTMKDFLDAGYIKSRVIDKNLVWYWTHNNEMDFGPYTQDNDSLGSRAISVAK